VPSFTTIAKRPDDELDGLGGLLATPHWNMPDMNLTRREIADFLADMRSLR
jgi:hypothetical protein